MSKHFQMCLFFSIRKIPCKTKDKRVIFLADILSVKSFSSVIRQKGESQNGSNKKTKYADFFRKTNISYPLIRTRTYVHVRTRG